MKEYSVHYAFGDPVGFEAQSDSEAIRIAEGAAHRGESFELSRWSGNHQEPFYTRLSCAS